MSAKQAEALRVAAEQAAAESAVALEAAADAVAEKSICGGILVFKKDHV